MTNKKDLVLALNAGSSSLKASLLQDDQHVLHVLGERLGTEQSTIHLNFAEDDDDPIDISEPNMDHQRVLHETIKALKERNLLEGIVAVGHRVVHGGTLFHDSTLVTDEALTQMESVSHLAPLHNPSNMFMIRVIRELLPHVPNVAVFDTSFHTTIPQHAYTYPLPADYRALQLRKFGFHGTSVKFVSRKAHALLDEKIAETKQGPYNLVVCHLGSGASVTAVVDGTSRDTSMGFTPLAGLMMGTRCGSVDPSIVGFACHGLNKTVDEVMVDLNKNSGLRGMVTEGKDYDMRALLQRQDDDDEARLAVDMFVYRLAQYIAGAMVALEGPLDALVFTAGIGEHSAEIRKRTVAALAKSLLPTAQLDADRNNKDGEESRGVLSVEGSWPLLLDIPTDEEAMIGIECRRVLEQQQQPN